MSDEDLDRIATSLFSEMLTADQLIRARLSRALPKGMELSHFSVLNYLAQHREEKSPGELARIFYLTRGAMTNTLNKLEWAGHIHIRPDWDDARRKRVAISGAGLAARDAAIARMQPILAEAVRQIGPERARASIPVIRQLRQTFASGD
ncbi:MAG: MarR family transcriptional regulator [Pseudomonadota bacterium]